MFCGKCGSQIPEGAKFCAKCGTPTTSSPEQPNSQSYSQNYNVNYNAQPDVRNDIPEPEKKPKKKKKASKRIASLIAILVAVAFIFSGIYIFVIRADDWYYRSKVICYNIEDGEAEKYSETEYFENGLPLSYTIDEETVTEISYDKHGRISSMKSEEDGEEYSLEFEYSKDGKNYVASDSAELDGGKIEVEVTYDKDYNIILEKGVKEEDGEKTEFETEYEYKNGREISQISRTDGEKKSEINYDYYSNGKIKTGTIEAGSEKIVYEYDKDGNEISYTRYDEDDEVEYKRESTYEKGRLIGKVCEEDGETTSELKLDKKDDDVYKFKEYYDDELSGYQYMYYEGKNLVKTEVYDEDKNPTDAYEYEYDKHSNKTSEKEYDYDESGEKSLSSQTEYEYSRKSFRQFFKDIKLFF